MLLVPPSVASLAVRQLAHADYTVATRISEAVAAVVPWALEHRCYALADVAMEALRACDELGGTWIHLATWLVTHAHP